VTTSLEAKLGSILVHVEEYMETGQMFDWEAVKGLLNDPEVRTFRSQIPAVLLPRKRSDR